ncbi:MAG: energy transducer TonB [Opitutaceae bacterium]|nr:energy transducer TonB [Opitutaceae bacterium]
MISRSRSAFLSFTLAVAALLPSIWAQDANGIYNKVEEPPVPVKTPPPKYPEAMRRDGVSGVVAVTVVIDEKGSVTEATVSKSTHPDFERPSLDAMRSWKFKPAKVGGEPVKVRVTVPMRFNVQD